MYELLFTVSLILSFFQPISRVSGENGKSIIKVFGNDVAEFSRILEQLNKNDNVDDFANRVQAVKELLAGNTATRLELTVSDEEFHTRIQRDIELINDFYKRIEKIQSQHQAINISDIASQVGITDTKTPNLYAEIIQKTADELGDAESATKAYEESQNKQRVAVMKTTKATIGQRVAVAALNTALSVAAGVGVSLLIQGIAQLLTYEQRAIDKANELVSAYNQQTSEISSNLDTLENLQEEYDKLSQGVDKYGRNISLTADEYERYRDIVAEVLGMTPSLRVGYDQEGNAIANKNSLIERSIELLKEQLRLEREEFLSSENLWDITNGYKKEYDRIQSQQNATNLQNITAIGEIAGLTGEDRNNEEKNNFLLDYLGMDEKSFRKMAYSTADGMKKLKNQLLDEIDEFYQAAANRPDIFSEEDLDSLNQMIESSENYAQSLDKQNRKILSTLQQVPQLSEFYDNLGSNEQNFLTDFINSLDIDLDKIENTADIENIKSDLLDLTNAISENPSIQSAIEDFYSIDFSNIPIEKYKKQIEQLSLKIQEALPENESIDYKAALNIVLSTDQDIDGMVQAAKDKIGNSFNTLEDPTVVQIQTILDPDFEFDPDSDKTLEQQIQDYFANQQYEANVKVALEANIENFEKLKNISEETKNIFSEFQSAASSLSSTINKLNEGTALSGSEMLDLIMTYPELASQIQVTNDGYTISTETLEALRQQEVLKAQEGIQSQIEHTKAIVESTQSIISAYGLQIESIKSLADAEAALAGGKTGLYNLDVDKFVFDDSGNLLTYGDLSAEEFRKTFKNPDKAIETLATKVNTSQAVLKIGEMYDQLNALRTVSENMDNFSPPSSSKESKDEKDAWLEAYEEERAALDHKYKMELISSQEYYDGLEKLRKKYFDGNSKYLEQDRGLQEELFDLQREISSDRVSDLEHEIYLLQQRENTEEQQIGLYKKIKDETNKQLKAAYDYGLDDHDDYVQELQKQWIDANQNIVDIYEDQLSELEKQRDEFMDRQSNMLDEYMSILDEEIEKLEQDRKNEEEYWDKKIEAFKKEHEELEEINDLEEKRLRLQNLRNQKNVLMYDSEKGWIRTYDHEAVDEAQKEYDDALAEKEYNDQLDRLESQRDAALKVIDDEIKAIEDLQKTYEDEFDKINKAYELNADELKSLADFSNMTREEQEEYLKEFVANYQVHMDSMVAEINKIEEAARAAKAAIDALLKAEEESASSGSGGGSSSGSSSNKPGSSPMDGIVIDSKGNAVTWKGETVSASQKKEWEDDGWSYVGNGGWKWKDGQTYYKFGGVVDDTGLAQLHGTSTHSEVVFNSTDAKKLYDYIHNTPSMIMDLSRKLFGGSPASNLKIAQQKTSDQAVEQHFHIGQLSFPNAVDAKDVIDAIKELPTYVMQKKYKR